MSGHSKWSTIKRKKEATDAVKGKTFSKLSRAIHIAVKTGGGNSPDTNYKLRMAIEAARSSNMPKANIDRILAKSDEAQNLEEVIYEGFGPQSAAILVEVATDNRNRTGQEIKGIFERGGGSLAGPGAVSYNFETKGVIRIKKDQNFDTQILKLIDLGIEDYDEEEGGLLELYVEADRLSETKDDVSKMFEVIESEIVKRPINLVKISDKAVAEKIIKLLSSLEEHDDVQSVYANVDIDNSLGL